MTQVGRRSSQSKFPRNHWKRQNHPIYTPVHTYTLLVYTNIVYSSSNILGSICTNRPISTNTYFETPKKNSQDSHPSIHQCKTHLNQPTLAVVVSRWTRMSATCMHGLGSTLTQMILKSSGPQREKKEKKKKKAILRKIIVWLRLRLALAFCLPIILLCFWEPNI